MGNRFIERFLSQLPQLYAEGSHMARVALLRMSGGPDLIARDASKFCTQAEGTVAAALISAGHEVTYLSQLVQTVC
jgi:hypothetical protein